jgi:hypothetical protein
MCTNRPPRPRCKEDNPLVLSSPTCTRYGGLFGGPKLDAIGSIQRSREPWKSVRVYPLNCGSDGRRPRGYYQPWSEPSVDQLVGGARTTPDSDPDRDSLGLVSGRAAASVAHPFRLRQRRAIVQMCKIFLLWPGSSDSGPFLLRCHWKTCATDRRHSHGARRMDRKRPRR